MSVGYVIDEFLVIVVLGVNKSVMIMLYFVLFYGYGGDCVEWMVDF